MNACGELWPTSGAIPAIIRVALAAGLTAIDELQQIVRDYGSSLTKAGDYIMKLETKKPSGISVYWAILAYARARGILPAVAESTPAPTEASLSHVVKRWEDILDGKEAD